jgi:hypothetical protein
MDRALILKCVSLLVTLFGTICSIVMWFLGKFNLGGFTTGVVLIFLNVLIGLAELHPALWVEKHFAFLLSALGRAGFLAMIGLIFAGDHGLWIACWVIYWVLGAFYLLIAFTGDSLVPNAMGAKFKGSPLTEVETARPDVSATPIPEYPPLQADPYAQPE